MGTCSWGQPAISACHRGPQGLYCGQNYQCDAAAGGDGLGRCCSPSAGGIGTGGVIGGNTNLGNNLGLCSWGQPAASACNQGTCSIVGYQCDMTVGNGQGRCCLPNAGGIGTGNFGNTNVGNVFGYCSWGQPAISACNQGQCFTQGYQCDMSVGNGQGRCCLPNAGGIGTGIIGNVGNTNFGNPLGTCSWGQPAVSACMQGPQGRYCNRGYQCDLTAGNGQGRCCLPSTGTVVNPGFGNSPRCRDGNPVIAYCMNGRCGPGLVCSPTDNYCCLSNTQASAFL